MGDIILPGDHGIGTIGFVPTAANYDRAADHLVRLHDGNCHVDTSSYEVRRVLDYFGASNMDDLRVQRRGW